jgi:predicted MFS family arabinose efflux permease
VLAGLGWLCVFYVVPEGLAVPYAAAVGGGSTSAGLLLAAIPCGAACGAIAFSRLLLPARRLVLMGPLAVVTCAPLVVFAARPGLVLAIVLFAASGAASAYQLAANAAFVAAVPPEARGTAFGLVQAVMCVGQGLSVVAAGAAAQLWEPGWVITAAGVGGCVVAARLAAQWRRSTAESVPNTLESRPGAA